MTTVRDLLRVKGRAIWSIPPETTTLDALRLMTEKNVGALLVLQDDALVGIISERDFVHQIAHDSQCFMESPVREVMTTQVYTVTPKESIEECMQLMTDRHIRHLPVMEQDRLVGLISIGDVVKSLISDQSSLIQDLEKYIQGAR